MTSAFISMHPAPYRDALIEKIIANSRGVIDVYNLYNSDVGHKFWGLTKANYIAKCISEGLPQRATIRLALRILRRFVFSRSYSCIVWPGYVEWPVRLGIIAGAILRKSYILCIDSVEQPRIGFVSYLIKKWMIGKARLIFVPGLASKEFVTKEFAIPSDKIICGVYALDNTIIFRKIESLRRGGIRKVVRERLGLDVDTTMWLMVANMIPSRKYPVTSAGFVRFANGARNNVFVMVGKGPDYEKMQLYAETNPCLRAINGCSFDEMLELYAAADVYVHGGKEPASTALVIGAISELPIISSDAVGCSADVLIDGQTGFRVEDYLSEASWCNAFLRASSKKSLWHEMGQKAHEKSNSLDADLVAKDFVERMNLLNN